MSAVRGFFGDVWADLRARRLLPVAGLLLVALIAAPVVLSKGSEEPPAPDPTPAGEQPQRPQGPEELAQVKLEELGAGTGSSLSSFDASNPFAPPPKVLEAAREQTQETSPLTEFGGGADGGAAGGDAPQTGSVGTGSPGGGTTGGGGGDGTTTTTNFTYVLDVTFWSKGRKRQIDGMKKLGMLPSEASPLLIFMGVDENAANAVFLVDSTLETAGEGTCAPRPRNCAFLYLGAGSQQEFTNADGDTYRLRIDQIRRVELKGGSDDGKADVDPPAGEQEEEATPEDEAAPEEEATGSAAGGRRPRRGSRRFSLPDLVDLVVESRRGGSRGARGGR